MTTTVADTPTGQPARRRRVALPGPIMLWLALAVLVSMSLARIITGNADLTSPGTFGVAFRTAAPIALAGLGGLWSERAGVVNIGLEGMMIMGTVFAGWWGWEYGPWMAVLGGIVGGCLGGLAHAVATVTFGVNHIVSGFAITFIAPGVARFMAGLLFDTERARADGGSITNSPDLSSDLGSFTMPFTSGGDLFGASTPAPLARIADWDWFAVSDLAGFLTAVTTEVRLDLVLMVLLFVATAYVLWRTPLGLRVRSAGERPGAADSLGVRVTLYKYMAVVTSGGLAGLGGAVLALNTRYSQGQTGGRGYLGLASLIVGNWRPSGVAAGAGLFGFFDGTTQRLNADQLVLALLLAGALLLGVGAAYTAARGSYTPAIVLGVAALAALLTYNRIDSIPDEFVFASPFLVTLLVVAARGQASRAPASVGLPWRKGDE